MLSIRNGSGHQFTLVANDFIDSYMTKANGEYVKVYLLLLRRMDSGKGFSVSELADILEITEGDILRAFRYWAKEGLLTIEYGAGGDISGLLMGNAETENKKNETTAKTQDSLSCSDPIAEAESSPQEDEPWGAIPEHTEEPAHADSSAKKKQHLRSVTSVNTKAGRNSNSFCLSQKNISADHCPLRMWR